MEDELHILSLRARTPKKINLHIQDEQNLQMQQDCWREQLLVMIQIKQKGSKSYAKKMRLVSDSVSTAEDKIGSPTCSLICMMPNLLLLVLPLVPSSCSSSSHLT